MRKTPFVFAGLALLAGAGTALAAWSSILPTGEGSYLQWTPSSGATHYTLVDETTCNGVTDYVRTTTVGQRDSYAVSLAGVPSGALITRIDVKPCASRQTGGGTAPIMKVFYRVNGVSSLDAGSYSLNGTTPVELATTSWTGLSITKTATTTLESGVILFSGTKGARLSRLATAIEYTPLPTAPTNLVATWPNTANLNIQLTWADNSSNETGFRVERSTDGVSFVLATTTQASTTSAVNVAPGAGSYYYRIASVNAAGQSAYSSTSQVTIAAPNTPSGLAVTSQSLSVVWLGWADTATNEHSFLLERSTNGVNYSFLATTSANVTQYADFTATQGSTYYYRIAASNYFGTSAFGTTTPNTALFTPNSPSSLSASLIGTSSAYILLGWTDGSSEELGFDLERSQNSTSSFTTFVSTGPNTVNWNDFSSASTTGTWYYRVRAFNLKGNSEYSDIASVIVP